MKMLKKVLISNSTLASSEIHSNSITSRAITVDCLASLLTMPSSWIKEQNRSKIKNYTLKSNAHLCKCSICYSCFNYDRHQIRNIHFIKFNAIMHHFLHDMFRKICYKSKIKTQQIILIRVRKDKILHNWHIIVS